MKKSSAERWFVYVLFKEQLIRHYIDALIFLSNPSEKNACHMTLQGPLKNPDKVNISEIRDGLCAEKVSIVGVGKFFNEKQNTIYLRCDSLLFKNYWKKPDYPYNPHITIYNGGSREFASKLLEILGRHRFFFELTVKDVVIGGSYPKQMSWDLALDVDLLEIEASVGRQLPISDFKNLEDWQRLMYLERLASKLKYVSLHNRAIGKPSLLRSEPARALRRHSG